MDYLFPSQIRKWYSNPHSFRRSGTRLSCCPKGLSSLSHVTAKDSKVNTLYQLSGYVFLLENFTLLNSTKFGLVRFVGTCISFTWSKGLASFHDLQNSGICSEIIRKKKEKSNWSYGPSHSLNARERYSFSVAEPVRKIRPNPTPYKA